MQLKNTTTRARVEAVFKEQPEKRWKLKDIVEKVGEIKQTVSYHLDSLIKEKIIAKDDKAQYFLISTEMHDAQILELVRKVRKIEGDDLIATINKNIAEDKDGDQIVVRMLFSGKLVLENETAIEEGNTFLEVGAKGAKILKACPVCLGPLDDGKPLVLVETEFMHEIDTIPAHRDCAIKFKLEKTMKLCYFSEFPKDTCASCGLPLSPKVLLMWCLLASRSVGPEGFIPVIASELTKEEKEAWHLYRVGVHMHSSGKSETPGAAVSIPFSELLADMRLRSKHFDFDPLTRENVLSFFRAINSYQANVNKTPLYDSDEVLRERAYYVYQDCKDGYLASIARYKSREKELLQHFYGIEGEAMYSFETSPKHFIEDMVQDLMETGFVNPPHPAATGKGEGGPTYASPSGEHLIPFVQIAEKRYHPTCAAKIEPSKGA
jgi:DNA-binding MarR family transcriptional regulator